MESEKVKEIKKALEDNSNCEHYNSLWYMDNCKCITVSYADILTLINELESEKDNLYNLNQNLISDKQVLMQENERWQEKEGALSCELDLLNEKLTNAEIEVDDYKDRIAELEKENDDYYERCVILRRENEQLKTLVSSLEKKNIDLEEYIKGNEQDAKAFVNGWHKDLETELKQFAERLKEKKTKRLIPVGLDQPAKEVWFIKLTEEEIDETLKEFIPIDNNDNTCVSCSAIIPEGRQVCPNCEVEVKPCTKSSKTPSEDQ